MKKDFIMSSCEYLL